MSATVSTPPAIGSLWQRVLARPRLLALASGLVLALAIPPVNLLPAVFALSLLFHLSLEAKSGKRAALYGLLFGFAYYLATLYWVGIAFFQLPGAGRFAPPAVLLLVLVHALFTAAASWGTWLARRLGMVAAGAVFVLLWTAGEVVRGELLRFPWNPIAIVWSFSDLGLQPIAWIGVYAFGLLTVQLAILPAWLWRAEGGRLWPLLAGGLLLAAPFFVGWLRLDHASGQEGIGVRIVQPNIPQFHKWKPELRERWLKRHLGLAALPYEGPPPSLVLWPESAVPYRVEDREIRDILARVVPEGSYLAFGAERYFEAPDGRPVLTNSLYLLDDGGNIIDRYDKVDLVPFGEYVPFRDVLARFGIRKLTVGGLDFTPGPGRRTLAGDGLWPMSPLICYEAAFPNAATDGTSHARLLVNITNDAWFGNSSGPYQHFAKVRMRAVETGLPLIRAANTGISAIVDPFGRVVEMLPLGETGVIDGTVPAAIAPPPLQTRPWLPYAAVVGWLLVIALIDLLRKRAHKEVSPERALIRPRP